jgi:hypothetical protein
LAADTIETWDIGATDVDMYIGFDGMGKKKYEKTIYGDMMLGYGLANRFSAYFGTVLQGNEYFSDGSGNIYFGAFGTPVDTFHFNLDLFLNFSLGGSNFKEFQVTPAMEFNYNLHPDMSSWGLYLRAGAPIYGYTISTSENPNNLFSEMAYHLKTTIGTYFTLAEGHQLFLEYDMMFHPKPHEDEQTVESGGFDLGYNVMITDSIELINQVRVDIPQKDKSLSTGIMIGMIVTLPSG